MKHLIVYDIGDDGVRDRVAKTLEGYGSRVQESVFECRLEARELEELTARLTRELKSADNGQVRVYRVCESCLQASFEMGQAKAVDSGFCYIV